jgi:cyclophilin family peptidyl-prolyl cis-trans isomerase
MKSVVRILLLFLLTAPAGCLETQAPAVVVHNLPTNPNPVVNMQTSMGTIVIKLYAEKAPKTVENFLGYVNEGFYEGTIFHRVIEDFMIQGGGFTKDYQQKPAHEPIRNEANNGLNNVRGTVAMARTSHPHSATAQFFINVEDNNFLDHTGQSWKGWGYTVFGKVIEGMDVVDKIKKIETGPGGSFLKDVPQIPVVIEKMSVVKEKSQ